jgi:hypothetical protein
MPNLKDLPANTIWPHLLDAIHDDLEKEIHDYAHARQADVARNAETATLAAVLVDKYAAGMAKALDIVGVDSSVMQIADALVREIDPNFEAHREARWKARPADLLPNT